MKQHQRLDLFLPFCVPIIVCACGGSFCLGWCIESWKWRSRPSKDWSREASNSVWMFRVCVCRAHPWTSYISSSIHRISVHRKMFVWALNSIHINASPISLGHNLFYIQFNWFVSSYAGMVIVSWSLVLCVCFGYHHGFRSRRLLTFLLFLFFRSSDCSHISLFFEIWPDALYGHGLNFCAILLCVLSLSDDLSHIVIGWSLVAFFFFFFLMWTSIIFLVVVLIPSVTTLVINPRW